MHMLSPLYIGESIWYTRMAHIHCSMPRCHFCSSLPQLLEPTMVLICIILRFSIPILRTMNGCAKIVARAAAGEGDVGYPRVHDGRLK